MRRLFIFTAMILLLGVLQAPADEVSGHITEDTTWEGEIDVVGEVTVDDGIILTINPGTYVVFMGHYKLNVQGRLLAVGTEQDTITFTINDTTGFSNMDIDDGGWHGIRFYETPATNDSSKIVYCKLQYGKATGYYPADDDGGAIYVFNFSKLLIANNRITNNNVSNKGGGVYCSYYSAPILINNAITNNSAGAGGGIYCSISTPTITNNTITNNSAGAGGGIYCYYNSNPTLTNNTITNNSASYGGGISCYYHSNPTLTDNILTNNSGSSYGGGIYCNESNPTLSNNTITNNSASYGGGISCYYYSNPILSDNTLTNNSASSYGGGLYCNESNPTLINNTITNNSAFDDGGGIYCYNSELTLINNTITNNNAFDDGGGIFCYYLDAVLTNNIITNNNADSGGGIYCWYSNPTLTNNTITDNSAIYYGGGIYCGYSNPSLTNNIITNNNASYRGGGISCLWGSNPALENNTVTNNSATEDGGGIYCWNSNPILTNNTITNNSAYDGGGIYCGYTSYPILTNCILWDNSPQEINGSATVTYSDIQGGWTGEGNIDIDPLFVNEDEQDYHLQESSPCIDAGNPDEEYNDPEDPDNPGYALYPAMGTLINDMGAYGGPGALDFTGIEDEHLITELPAKLRLYQNYPNPFNPTTTIAFTIPQTSQVCKTCEVSLGVYDITGKLIKTLIDKPIESGYHSVIWDGADENGKGVASGVYFYKLKAGDFSQTRKCLLLK